MGSFFSKSANGKTPIKKAKLSDKDEAILQLKVTRDRVEKLKKKNEGESAFYVTKARQLLHQGRKEQAKLALRTKKYKDKQILNLDNQLLNLVQMIQDLEWADMQSEIVEGIQTGTKTLKKLNELMPVDEVEKLLDESAEAVAYQEEINQLLSEGLDQADETVILAEFAELQKQELQAQQNTKAAQKQEEMSLPEPPKNRPILQERDQQAQKAKTELRQPVPS